MKVLRASLWVYGKNVKSKHDLQLLVDKIPDRNNMRYERKGSSYRAENDGFVSHYRWSGDGNDGGLYGREFDITLTNGMKVTLKGAWFSRCGVMNQDFKPHCIDVKITDNKQDYDNGSEFMGGAITVDLAREVIGKYLPEWMIVGWPHEHGYDKDDISYMVVRKDDPEDKRDTDFYNTVMKGLNGRRYV